MRGLAQARGRSTRAWLARRGALLRITLLAAGFVIGEEWQGGGGGEAHAQGAQAGHARTHTCCWDCPRPSRCFRHLPPACVQCSRPTRVFRAEGPPAAVAHALGVICDGVERYKELCEGKYAGACVPNAGQAPPVRMPGFTGCAPPALTLAGQTVGRVQEVSGVCFSYQPPPRNVVPFAAALKGQSSRCGRGGGGLAAHSSLTALRSPPGPPTIRPPPARCSIARRQASAAQCKGGGGCSGAAKPPAGPSFKASASPWLPQVVGLRQGCTPLCCRSAPRPVSPYSLAGRAGACPIWCQPCPQPCQRAGTQQLPARGCARGGGQPAGLV